MTQSARTVCEVTSPGMAFGSRLDFHLSPLETRPREPGKNDCGRERGRSGEKHVLTLLREAVGFPPRCSEGGASRTTLCPYREEEKQSDSAGGFCARIPSLRWIVPLERQDREKKYYTMCCITLRVFYIF